jgi:hypothetical protein
MTIRVAVGAPGKPHHSLTDVLNRDLLASRAGWLNFERGLDYSASGHVTDVEVTAHRATAVVIGTRPYEVAIEHVGSALEFDCSCPVGAADEFCKHLVALGLELVGDLDDEPVPSTVKPAGDAPVALETPRTDRPGDGHEDLLGAKAAPEPDVSQEPEVRQEPPEPEVPQEPDVPPEPEVPQPPSVQADADTSELPALSALRTTIANVFTLGHLDEYGYVRYVDVWTWRRDVESVIDKVEDLLAAGFAAETAELAETVLRELNDSVGQVDDTDGHLHELFEATMDLHLRACRQARPDPVALAERLYRWATEWELDLFLGAIRAYAPVLGDVGLAAFHKVATQRWEEVPPIGPRDDPRAEFGTRFRIATVMEHLAEITGGLDELLEVMQRNQASGSAFVRIVLACRDHARDDLALEWARRGLEAFPGESRLTELIGDIHASAGRHDDALTTDREMFAKEPSLVRYQRLKQRADAAERWPAEREPALAAARAAIERSQRETSEQPSPWHRADGSTLVEILLWEGNSDDAWEAAQQYGCNDRLWLQVAAARGEQHPGDALEIYQRQLDRALESANNRAYDEAMRLLKVMRPLYTAMDRGEDFTGLVTGIRTRHKRRGNLMQRLDGVSGDQGS